MRSFLVLSDGRLTRPERRPAAADGRYHSRGVGYRGRHHLPGCLLDLCGGGFSVPGEQQTIKITIFITSAVRNKNERKMETGTEYPEPFKSATMRPAARDCATLLSLIYSVMNVVCVCVVICVG